MLDTSKTDEDQIDNEVAADLGKTASSETRDQQAFLSMVRMVLVVFAFTVMTGTCGLSRDYVGDMIDAYAGKK